MFTNIEGVYWAPVCYTPISRSRHFEIESEAPVGRNPEVLPLITGAAMSYCCVPGCTSYQRKECDKELSFHRFPMFFFNKTARGIRHPSSAHFSTSAILNRGSSSRLVVQVIVVYLYFRVSSHRSLAFDFKMAAAWNRRIVCVSCW